MPSIQLTPAPGFYTADDGGTSLRRNSLYPLILTAALGACADTDTSDVDIDKTGADQDIHGCIGSAGYIWCERTTSCERPWELAKRKGLTNTEREFNAYCSGAQTQKSRIRYSCESGESIEVEFSGTGEATLYHDDTVAELSQLPAASGYFYTNGRVGIRGKGNAILLEIGRMAPIQCQVPR